MSPSSTKSLSKEPSFRGLVIIESQALVNKFHMMNDVPAWLRGISWFQLAAANEVQNAIRDDIEQGSTFRVQRVLTEIGLTPLPPNRLLKITMRLSRGNDLAFLWFIMEACYRTNRGGQAYSVNEQLIMSCIAHLDMICTLRELDRILPPPNESKQTIERKKAAKERAKKLAQQRKLEKIKKMEETPILPYFQRLQRRHTSRASFRSKMPDTSAGIDLYGSYRDPTYEVPNESTRWFTNYLLSPSTRISKRLVRNEIESLFTDPEADESRRITENFLTSQLTLIFQSLTAKGQKKEHQALCKTHMEEKKRKAEEAEKRAMEKKKKCLKFIDVEEQSRKRRADRLLGELEKNVETYRIKYREKWDKSKTRVMVLHGNHLYEHIISDSETTLCQDTGMMNTCEAVHVLTYSNSCTFDFRLGGGEDMSPMPLQKSKSAPLLCTARVPFVVKGPDDIKRLKPQGPEPESLNFGYSETSTPTSSQMYFRRPAPNRPYYFDYPKVFNFEIPDKNIAELKAACLAALQEQQENDTVKNVNYITPDFTRAIDESVGNTWNKKVEEYNEILKETGCTPDEIFPGIARRDHYDCSDMLLMHDMLKAALKKMSQDPKYVLASMPDVHKLPILREWIYSRYGKKYSHSELNKLGKTSIKVFQALRVLPFNVKLPATRELGANLNVNYNCRDYLIKKSQMMRREFHSRYDNEIMRIAREFWFAMRPHLYAKQPPRTTFFSYMPPHVLTINHFRPWKPLEYMDAKSAWEKRRSAAAKVYK